MVLEYFSLNGYGYFVWPSFMFTFVMCFILYTKTIKEFQKQEKIFLSEFKQIEVKQVKDFKSKEIRKEVLSRA